MGAGNDTFNLTTEPWLPVLWSDGSSGTVSLVEAFARADSIRTLTGDISTQRFALHRLLLAILHRATGDPQSTSDWSELASSWPQVAEGVRIYLEHFATRFDLFHPSEPFFQVADLRTARNEVFGLERLLSDVPNGHQYFTNRSGSGLWKISPAEAARWLVHAHAYDTSGIKTGAVGDSRAKGGRGYPQGVAWAGLLGGIELTGSTLQETLLLNLIAPASPSLSIRTGEDDLPPWEVPQLLPENLPRTPRGFIDLYTWQSRRIRLHGDRDGVTGVVLSYGDKLTPQNMFTTEPMTAWRYSEPQTKVHGRTTYMPREHQPSRSFWRGLAALLPSTEAAPGGKGPARTLPPAVLTWAGELHEDGVLPHGSLVRVHATGLVYGSQSSVVDELVEDTLLLPAGLLAPHAAVLRATAIDAVGHTEAAVDSLANLARNLATASGAGDTDGHRDRAREAAYARIDAPFREWLTTLHEEEERDTALTRWHVRARVIIRGAGEQMLSDAGPSAFRGRRSNGRLVDTGQSAAWFSHALSAALPYAFPIRQETSA